LTTTLILIRHGQTDHNLHHRYQGQSDVPMNDAGRAQVRAAARHLAGVRLAAIYCSDLGRSREAAQIIAEHLGVELTVAPELRERNFGRIEGLTRDEAAARFPESWEVWRTHRATWIPPGGESLGEMWGRVLSYVETLWQRHQGQVFVIAGHGGPINAVICHALGASMEARRAIAIGNGSITIIARNEMGPRLVVMNDTCHLKEPPPDAEAD
jgi:broad specificity phosphatase PhoE